MLKSIIFTLLALVAFASSSALLAAEQPADEAVTVQPLPATPPVTEAAKRAENNNQPVNDNHIDYRYCLDLKTDREIAECRYKK